MSSPEQGGQGGAGNGGSGEGQGNQGNPAQATTTTSSTNQGFPTTTSSPVTSSTQTQYAPTSTSTSSSSGSNKTAIIGGIVGGLAGLLILSLIGIWLLNRRKMKQSIEKHGSAQRVTYAGLNSAFAGVPFAHRPAQSPHDSLTPVPLLNSSNRSSHRDIEMRGGEASPAESDVFLPTYAESQAATSIRGNSTLGRINTTHSHSNTNISPLSSTAYTERNLTPDSILPPVPPLHVARERDTMGFPIDGMSSPGFPSPGFPSPGLPSPNLPIQNFETIHIEPEIPLPIISPKPRHPLVHQDSLERQVREGMSTSDTPEPFLNVVNPNRLRVLSQEMPRESPILGLNSVRIQPQTQASGPPLSSLNPNSGGIDRMASQRTVSSISSMPPVVSDAELENLGVGRRLR